MTRPEAFDRILKPEPGRTALLVVDMQRGFLDPGEALEVPQAHHIVPRLRTSSRRSGHSGSPWCTRNSCTRRACRSSSGRCIRAQAGGARASDGLRPAVVELSRGPRERVDGVRARAAARRARRAQARVRRLRRNPARCGAARTRHHVAGGNGDLTDICVFATVIGAFHREYRVSVVEDCVATLAPEIQRISLDIIGRAYGRVVSSKEIATW